MATGNLGIRIGIALAALAAAAVLVALYLVFFVAPLEATMGIVQKIFYFHVGSAINMTVAFGVCALAGATYLVSRPMSARVASIADAVGIATAEVGVMLGAIVMVTGPLWAKVAWGTYWTWEPRLTLSLMVFLLFIAYLALRAYAGTDRFGRGVAAGLSILGLPGIYFIRVAVERWGGAHPQVVYKGGLTHPGMRQAFFASVIAMLLVTATLVLLRALIERRRQQVDALFLEIDRTTG